MANKGTQALLESDVSIIREIFTNDLTISVSTADVPGVKRLRLTLDGVFPTLVDIPYEVADFHARRSGWERRDLRYKVIAVLSLLNMPIQMCLSWVSSVLVRVGLKAFYRQKLIRRMKDCDVVLSCSNENFKESASLLPLNVYWLLTWWSMLASKTWTILVAKSLGKPVVMLPNSVGPFRTAIGRTLSRIALGSCESILIRDQRSFEIAEELGVRSRKILTGDTALLLKGSNDGLRKEGRVLGVSAGVYGYSLSEKKMQDYVLVHAVALDKIIESLGVSVVFLPHYVSGFKYDDLEISRMIRGKMRHSDKTSLINAGSAEEFKSLIGGVDILVSSKMHPCVLASSVYVPSLCIAYDHKQSGFFSSLGMDQDVIALQNVTSQRLYEKIMNLWDRKAVRQEYLKIQVPFLQAQLKEAIATAVLSALDQQVR
jgi:polysaccharide pyruvyl transferase WcaK-like protein